MKKLITIKTFKCISNALLTGILLFITFHVQAQNNWTRHLGFNASLLEDVAYGAGKYVAVGEESTIRTSTDGITWETQPINLSKDIYLLGIVYANGQFVTVGANGVICTSTDGISWAIQNSGTDKSLASIAFGSGTYVAVGYNGIILTSQNGMNWTNQPSGTNEILNDVTFGANATFVVVGDNGFIATSSNNGASWFKTVSVTTKALKSVTPGKNGNFAAVGNDGAILYSIGGYVWTVKFGPQAATSFSSVACNPTTGAFVVASTNTKTVVTSANGNYWGTPAIQAGSDFGFIRLRFINNHFFGVGYGGEMRSSFTDGKTWYFPGVNMRKMQLTGAAFGNGRYVAVGNSPLDNGTTGLGGSNLIISSSDAINFTVSQTVHLNGVGKSFNDVTFGNGKFVAVGDDAIIQTSVDGKTWSYSYASFGQTLKSVTYGYGRYVAVGSGGLILFSDDAKTWQKSDPLSTMNFMGVSFVGGGFILVGLNGALATSASGKYWDFRSPHTNNHLLGITSGGGKYMAVGHNHINVTSTNGINWNLQKFNPADVHFTDVCYANGQFVMVGLHGQVYSTGKNNVRVSAYSGTQEHLTGITYGNGLFLAVGVGGTLITSPFDDGPTPMEPESPKPSCGACRTANTESNANTESEIRVDFNVTTYPNPVDDQFSLNVEGATGGEVRMQLMNLSGRTIFDKVVNAESGAYQETISMSQKQTGIYLLRVSTVTNTQTVKILKQ